MWLFLPTFEFLLVQMGGTLAGLLVEARPVTEWVTITSPHCHLLIRMPVLAGSVRWSRIAWMIGLQLLYGTLMLALVDDPLTAVRERGQALGLRIFGLVAQRPAASLVETRAPCGDEPMIWKECTGTLSVGGPIKA